MRLNSIAYAETARAQWLGLLGAAVLLGSCSGCHGIERLIVGPRVDNEHPTQLRLIWHTATEASPVSYWFGQPALDNGKLFVEDANGIPTVYAIAVADGRLLWKKNVGQGWTFAGHVMGIAESGDTIYVNVWRFLTLNGYLSQGVLVALDRRNGSQLWRYESPDTASGFHFPPAVSGRLIVVSDLQGGRTLGLDRFTQQLLWTVPHHTNSTPVIVGDTVFGASNDLYAWAARLSTGALLWEKKTGAGSFFASTYCAGGVIANEGMLQRLEASNGAYTGAFNVRLDEQGIYTSALVADGTRVFFTGQGGVYAVACRP